MPTRLPRSARKRIDRAVRALTYSVDRLARDLGVTVGTLFNYRHGRTRAPRAALERLGRILRRRARLLGRLARATSVIARYPPGGR